MICRVQGRSSKSRKAARLCLCGTGSPFDVLSREGLTEEVLRDRARTPKHPVRMETANGEILAETTVRMGLEALGEPKIRPYVLEDSPDLISVGRRCRK